MGQDKDVTRVRGGEVRCTGPADDPHDEVILKIPEDDTVRCPECGRAFRRARGWNAISGAVWPRSD